MVCMSPLQPVIRRERINELATGDRRPTTDDDDDRRPTMTTEDRRRQRLVDGEVAEVAVELCRGAGRRAHSFPVLMDDVDEAAIDAGDQAQDAERDNKQVLPQAPVEPAETRVVPVRHQVDAAGQDQAQERQAQRAH